MIGTIIRNTGSWYAVKTDDGQLFDCKVKGTFRLKGIRSTNPVAVGDVVSFTPSPDGQTALIEDIEVCGLIRRYAKNLTWARTTGGSLYESRGDPQGSQPRCCMVVVSSCREMLG